MRANHRIDKLVVTGFPDCEALPGDFMQVWRSPRYIAAFRRACDYMTANATSRFLRKAKYCRGVTNESIAFRYGGITGNAHHPAFAIDFHPSVHTPFSWEEVNRVLCAVTAFIGRPIKYHVSRAELALDLITDDPGRILGWLVRRVWVKRARSRRHIQTTIYWGSPRSNVFAKAYIKDEQLPVIVRLEVTICKRALISARVVHPQHLYQLPLRELFHRYVSVVEIDWSRVPDSHRPMLHRKWHHGGIHSFIRALPYRNSRRLRQILRPIM